MKTPIKIYFHRLTGMRARARVYIVAVWRQAGWKRPSQRGRSPSAPVQGWGSNIRGGLRTEVIACLLTLVGYPLDLQLCRRANPYDQRVQARRRRTHEWIVPRHRIINKESRRPFGFIERIHTALRRRWGGPSMPFCSVLTRRRPI